MNKKEIKKSIKKGKERTKIEDIKPRYITKKELDRNLCWIWIVLVVLTVVIIFN